MEQTENSTPLRRAWANAIVQQLQIAAGRLLVLDRQDLQQYLRSVSSALQSPAGAAEKMFLRWLLLDLAWRSGRTIHERAHREARRRVCSFVPEAALRSYLGAFDANPQQAFIQWVDEFFVMFEGTHSISAANRVATIIGRDYRRPLSHVGLAKQVYMTPSQLRRAFHQEFGMSIHDYQRTVRVINALEQIGSGKVDAVACEVGYRGKNNLYRAMRQLTSMTPKDFRFLPAERARQVIESLRMSLIGHGTRRPC